MSPKQVCKIVYRLTKEGHITEREAFTLIESAFLAVLNFNEPQQQPVPEEPCKVAGFAGGR